ncbi:hypothetical protein HN643_04575 [Candidatus Falkowbacteria bacterium]|jgi:hypothetical protein|nr:hypothetical protein [Candidatus Falkowbacteria bacterium]MBT5503284.1 hypothetical protein [Candidatus Falkowbacteria bacterium]MBT6574507.1 hypothetical protein [Candidatus Falkowbacteria bacterium]MBT7500915.1 hypothetical protein [Candidatus Falkowbacteria bacterium]
MRKVKVYLFLTESPVMGAFKQSIDLFSVVEFVPDLTQAEVVVSTHLDDLKELYEQGKWSVLLTGKRQQVPSNDRLVVLEMVTALAGFMGLMAKIDGEE